MKPATNTLTDLFGADVRHLVPLYQRPYVWQRKPHWEPLWQDVVTVAEHQMGGDETRGHFLGAVVLEQDQTSPGEISRRLVIDGQQRLTTLQLLLSAASCEAADDGADPESRLLCRLVQNDPDMATGDDRFKLWPTNADRLEFVAVMTGAPRGPPTRTATARARCARRTTTSARRSAAGCARTRPPVRTAASPVTG
jgi:hypothetical protein